VPTQYANGAKAAAICDRCGFRYALGKLKSETIRGRKTSFLVCTECWSPDHPQNFQGMVPVNDPQALRNPRPDTGMAASRNVPNQPQSPLTTETNTPVGTEDGDSLTTE